LACQKPSAEVVALRVDSFKVSLKGLGGPTSKSLDICVRETVIGGLLGGASAEAMAFVRSWVRGPYPLLFGRRVPSLRDCY
jgi:hypothetical protein